MRLTRWSVCGVAVFWSPTEFGGRDGTVKMEYFGRQEVYHAMERGDCMSIHEFKANLSTGEEVDLAQYQGNVVLIVNTASKCGLTPQYEGIERLYRGFKDQGFLVLGFPCNQFGGQEPGTDSEIREFCSLHYDVTFPIFEKIDVNGESAHPLYQYLREKAPRDVGIDENSGLYQHLSKNAPELLEGSNIKWNFTKFLVNSDGTVVKRYAPTVLPEEIEADITALITM